GVMQALEAEKVTEVMAISSLTKESVDSLTTSIAEGPWQKGRSWLTPLCGQKEVPIARRETDWASQMRAKLNTLKEIYGTDSIPPELLPPAVIWRRLADNPATFIDFAKDLLEDKRNKTRGAESSSSSEAAFKLDFTLNDVPQSLTLPTQNKPPMGRHPGFNVTQDSPNDHARPNKAQKGGNKRKRKLCYKYLEGHCPFGDDCQFLHERSSSPSGKANTKDAAASKAKK
ncbi:hypothetical protein FOZ61_009325, partial [Perkinsus olseni]